MNDTPTLASRPHQPARRGTMHVPHRHQRLATLLGIVTIWNERERLRWALARMSRDNPHLIDDIGLTKRQLEAEITKPFWQI